MLNMELFSLLSSANSSEIPESKTYKQAISNQNPSNNNKKAALQEKTVFYINNDIWILTQLPLDHIAIDNK